jgi:stearoyl-CoA desaturase (delta-9 desaturase)
MAEHQDPREDAATAHERQGAVDGDDGWLDDGRVVWDAPKSIWFASITLAALLAAGPAFTRGAFALFAVTTAITLCAGHSVGIHRLLIHRAFRVPLALEHALVYLGVLVGLGGPLGLARLHDTRDRQQSRPRCHDYFAHRRGPLRDYLWNLHCRFEFAGSFQPRVDRRVLEDPFYRWLERTWRWQQLPWALLLLALGGWPWLVWGGLVRVAVGTTGHWFVGHVAHRRGYQGWRNHGAAVQGWNSLLLGALSMGEGWHNNHHAFPRSARMGHLWWELDAGWWLVAALRALGVAREVLLPGPASRAASAVREPRRSPPATARRCPCTAPTAHPSRGN